MKDYGRRHGCGSDRFLAISFERARFDGEADFSGRTFERATDFSNSRFCRPPNFDASTNPCRDRFLGANIGFGRPGRLVADFRKYVFPFSCACFEKSRKRQRTTISNATYISRNAKPSAASISFSGLRTG